MDLIWMVSLAGNACLVKGVKKAARLKLQNGSADCDQMWCVVREVVMNIAQVHLHVRSYTITLSDKN